ncbi:MAG: helix-turn-helix transcriptional regulator [Magnetococcales bacterium]|nr:helix-turn-helix transcriptional regulator [Magnetococcales bacterium]MBF0114152.1 helix-turn-helix transcriptional regulator [Magnetococcales bacterium]
MISNLVGMRIRALRGQRKKTQQQLADLAGIPRATLASVERDDANPSLAVVFKIATALGMTIDELVESEQRRIQHVAVEKMRRSSSGDGLYQAITVSPPGSFHFNQLAFRLSGQGVYPGVPHPPGSEEYLHVLAGEVELEVAGEHLLVRTGETAAFRGNVRHSYRNPGATECWAIVTILEGVGKDNFE